MKKSILIILLIILALVLLGSGSYLIGNQILNNQPAHFDGERAYQDIITQVNFGARHPGTSGHEELRQWIVDSLIEAGWQVETPEGDYKGEPIFNIIAKRGSGTPFVVFGAHYDTREFADRDAELRNQNQPVPGANDGASGVAVLLEMARTLPENTTGTVWMVFFDAEDQGGINQKEWIRGSRTFVTSQLPQNPDAVVIVDMIGDKDLNIFKEKNSDRTLMTDIWNVAKELGYQEAFIPQFKYAMLDDHTPFQEVGIPAVDLIDFDYPAWHTLEDTSKNVSAQSLQIIGDVLLNWLKSFMP